MWSLLLPFAKTIIRHQPKSARTRRLIVEILEGIVRNTDNDLDDAMLRRIKKAILVPTGVPLSRQLLGEQKQL
tara:strand:- start:55 stop:273 length:219 start_codon:yes stop_codon:yes gene_type:complete